MNSEHTIESLELTEKEIKAVSDYIGTWHTRINLLCHMSASSYDATQKDWAWPKNKTEFAKVLDSFVNLYSAMLKLDKPSLRPVLYRGSLHRRSFATRTNYFRSTSTEHDIATSFTEYNNGEMSRYHVPMDVPVLDVQSFKHDYSIETEHQKDEAEYIISPFVETEVRPDGITPRKDYQNSISVVKVEIEEVSPEELEKLRTELISGYESFLQDIKDEVNCHRDEKRCQQKLNISIKNIRSTIESGELSFNKQKLEEVKKESEALFEKNTIFRKKVIRYIHGMCRQREIEISKLKEEKAIQDEAYRLQEEEQKSKERKAALYKGLHEQYDKSISQFELLSSDVSTNAADFSNMVNTLYQTASSLGTTYNDSETLKLQQLYQEIQSKLNKKIEELKQANSFVNKEEVLVNSEWDKLEGYSKATKEIGYLLPPIKHLTSDYQSASENSIKKDLYTKVFYSLRSIKYYHYMNQLEALKSERPGLLDWFTGKAAMRNEHIRELELKMEYESYATPKEQSKYSIHDILSDIYYTFDAELHQAPTPEMQSIIDGINSRFQETQRDVTGIIISRPFPREQLVQDRYNQLAQSNMIALVPEPTGIASLFANRTKAKAIKSHNEILESKVNQAKQTYSSKASTPHNHSLHSSAFNSYKDALLEINKQLDYIDSDDCPRIKTVTRENIKESLKKGDTLELWAPQ